MASILGLKRRIKAAQNVSKTTRAMQMIAASKLKKAQDATLSSRPYVEKLTIMAQGLKKKLSEDFSHPYLHSTADLKKTLLIVLSPDKGLCGGLIANLLREFTQFTKNESETTFITVGKKLESQVAHYKNEVIASFQFGTQPPSFEMVYPISHLIDEYYLSGRVSSVKILGAHFTSVFTQKPKITSLLPIILPEATTASSSFTLFEPDVASLLPPLFKHYVEMTLYHLLLDSFLSEQASRMIAMQNATDNARDIIAELQLEYNKTRQAKITSEILDITNNGSKKKDT